jgi:hypothetical protein
MHDLARPQPGDGRFRFLRDCQSTEAAPASCAAVLANVSIAMEFGQWWIDDTFPSADDHDSPTSVGGNETTLRGVVGRRGMTHTEAIEQSDNPSST